MRRSVLFSLTVGLCLIAVTTVTPADLYGQDVERYGLEHGVRPPAGYYDVLSRSPDAFQFRRALVPWAREIFERRHRAMEAVDLEALNGRASAAAMAVTGTVKIPVLYFKYDNTTNASLPTSGELDTKLFGTPSPPTYSVRTLYTEMSRDSLTLDGDVIGPFTVEMADTMYEGSCNGLPGNCMDEMLGELLVEVIDSAEAAGVDFSPYDFDSDGFVDFVAFLHPELGGECGTSNVWAHRFVLSSSLVSGSSYSTDDGVTIDDYIIQGAVGGSSGCADSTAIMPIGTFAHETGHAFGLPDLYDTTPSGSPDTEGIGEWGLMGSGNFNTPESPAHMMAWSLFELGWIAVDTLVQGTGTVRSLTVPPIIDSDIDPDTAWAVCTSADPANCLTEEYFLVENRTKRGADVNVRVPAADGAGLLIWHIDPDAIASGEPTNAVNGSSPFGVFLEQADGLNELFSSTGDRGDTGDPWPGSSAATTFGPTTTPDSELNDGSDSGVSVDSIEVQADSSITLSLSTGVEAIVTTSFEGATSVIVDGDTSSAPNIEAWGLNSTHTIATPDTQVTVSGDVRYIFESWSDVAPPTNEHDVTPTDLTPDTFTATLRPQHLLDATATAGGSVSADVGGPVILPYWADTTDVASLTASTDPDGVFDAFTGDTTTADNPLSLSMDRPWSVTASFLTTVSLAADTLRGAVMGASYSDSLVASGGNGSFVWTLTAGALPAGLALDTLTGDITGVPEESGDFALTARATSSGINVSLDAEANILIEVGEPSLVLNDVVGELLTDFELLTSEETRYLDLLGNDNGRFDVGDFRAWLEATNQLAAPAATGALDALEASSANGNR